MVGTHHDSPHIALGLDSGPPVVTLTEMGDRLSVWGWGTASAELDPDSARDLAAELIAWADRRARIARAS